MPTRRPRRGPSIASILLGLALAACAPQLDPIRVDEGVLTIENRSDREWRDVRVTVNAYYHGESRSVGPHGRLEAPLSGFVTGFGQHFNRVTESVHTVEVRATDSAGQPVTMSWNDKAGFFGNRGK